MNFNSTIVIVALSMSFTCLTAACADELDSAPEAGLSQGLPLETLLSKAQQCVSDAKNNGTVWLRTQRLLDEVNAITAGKRQAKISPRLRSLVSRNTGRLPVN